MRGKPQDVRQDPGGALARAAPTSEFWRYLWFPAVFSVGSLLLRQDLVFLLGALAVGCGAAAYPLCRRNLAGVRVRRLAPARARVGVPLPLGYEVVNDGPRAAVGIDVEDRLGRGAQPTHQRFEVPCLAPGRRVVGRWPVVFARRGLHVLSAPRVSSRFPLGVFRGALAPGPEGEILVRPREGRPTAALLRRLVGGADEAARRSSGQRGADLLYGVREHREGDDPRRIHWRTSARRGQTVVADWRAEEGREVLVVLARAPERGEPRAFERAVSVTATLWRALHRSGRPARLALGTGGAPLPSSARGLALGLDALASVRPTGGRRPLAALRRLGDLRRPRSVVVVTTGADARALAAARVAAGPGGDAWVLDASGSDRAHWVEGLP